MEELIKGFPEQLTEALKSGEGMTIQPHTEPIHKIIVAGMGGSGIGANFVATFVEKDCRASFHIAKGYDIPAWVDKNTLAIASSYSGNTEETLSCLEQMMQTGAKVVGVSSDGKVKEIAARENIDFVQLKPGIHSPRACLGYSFVAQMQVLANLGLIPEQKLEEVRQAADFLEKEQEEIRRKADKIAFMLQDKLPVIYTTDKMEAVAIRFRQQLNENAKMLAWHHVIPEMNHNELVGWRTDDSRLAVIFLRNADDATRNQVRMDIVKDVVNNFTDSVIEIFSKGSNLIERSLYLVHLADWISFYLAGYRNMDVVEIMVIEYLKEELGKV